MSVNPITYTCFQYSFVTDEILGKCSTLFNHNYGVWSDDAPLQSNNKLQSGTRVKLGVKRLCQLLLFNDRCSLVTAELRSSAGDQPELIGHAFYASAKYDRLKGSFSCQNGLFRRSSRSSRRSARRTKEMASRCSSGW